MARRSKPPVQPRQPANLTAEDIRATIPRLEKRIEELRSFDLSVIETGYDSPITALENRIDATLVKIFGSDSLDYDRYAEAKDLSYKWFNIWRTDHSL